MRLIVKGREINLTELSPEMDQRFLDLHTSYITGQPINWQTFENAATAFFESKRAEADRWGAHDHYFNNFTPIWNDMLTDRNFGAAEHIWELALEPAMKWENANTGERIHKGSPYYFRGMTALLAGDLDRGYLLMHQAVEEDKLTHRAHRPNTPGVAFVSLNYAEAKQAFREWVILQAQFIDGFVRQYSTNHKRRFSLEDFRVRFLSKPPSVEVIFSLAHTVARFMKLSQAAEHSKKNDFAGQLELNLLFDLTLVIDAAVAAKNVPAWKFIDHARKLIGAAGKQIGKSKLEKINKAFQMDFDLTLTKLLDGTFEPMPGVPLTRFQSDVAITYGIRNRGAHKVVSAATVWQRFEELERILFGVLFAVIDHLYEA